MGEEISSPPICSTSANLQNRVKRGLHLAWVWAPEAGARLAYIAAIISSIALYWFVAVFVDIGKEDYLYLSDHDASAIVSEGVWFLESMTYFYAGPFIAVCIALSLLFLVPAPTRRGPRWPFVLSVPAMFLIATQFILVLNDKFDEYRDKATMKVIVPTFESVRNGLSLGQAILYRPLVEALDRGHGTQALVLSYSLLWAVMVLFVVFVLTRILKNLARRTLRHFLPERMRARMAGRPEKERTHVGNQLVYAVTLFLSSMLLLHFEEVISSQYYGYTSTLDASTFGEPWNLFRGACMTGASLLPYISILLPWALLITPKFALERIKWWYMWVLLSQLFLTSAIVLLEIAFIHCVLHPPVDLSETLAGLPFLGRLYLLPMKFFDRYRLGGLAILAQSALLGALATSILYAVAQRYKMRFAGSGTGNATQG